ncbi:cholecystokinin receptor-like, partial [Nothobranchius furzeri]
PPLQPENGSPPPPPPELGNTSLEVSDYNISCSNTSPPPPPAFGVREMGRFRILLYTLIFLLSVFGNLLIIVVLTANKRMRTVTNSFLLSLAVSDLMMAIFCMPFTLIPNILQDFIFGATMCKLGTYLMGVSVSISTFSLVAIATERYSAICNPFKSRAWQTRSHAYRVIAATWVVSLLFMLPYPVFNVLKSFPKKNGSVGHQCRLDWPSQQVEQTWYVLVLFALFFIPGLVMSMAYGLISRELYRGMQFELSQNKDTTGQRNGVGRPAEGVDDDDGCYVQVKKKTSSMELPTLSASCSNSHLKSGHACSNKSDVNLEAKRRVVRMLMVIVVLFFVCWMPLYSVNTWKAFDSQSATKALSGAPISFIHLLTYTSACVNPIIYCFMNTRFRGALRSTFYRCCCRKGPFHRCRRRENDDGTNATSMAASMSKFGYTTVSTTGVC